ncbi:AAA family ATPase [Plesiocystis pacifica]|nr:AAA family ATPase [Plesiocystis pacifica]
MLTRLEVDGFKNLLGFAVDFGPFTCIAGPNAVGKSNVFDAIDFLSALADRSLLEAASLVRTTHSRAGDPRDLFWTDGVRRAAVMRFAAEMIVSPHVEDAFGRRSEPSTTYMRYEVHLGYEAPTGLATRGRLVLLHEKLEHIRRDEASKRLGFKHSAKKFRQAVLRGRPTGKHPFIYTERNVDGQLVINQSQDKHGGRPSPSPAKSAQATLASGVATTEHPTILAAQKEMQSWRRLALEPAAMREPDAFSAPNTLGVDGSRLAATLYSLANRQEGEDAAPEEVYAALANRMSDLVPVRGIRVERDDKRELLTLELEGLEGGFLPARALSDGTLRFLALAVLGIDPRERGVICMEEPENGIHPARIEAMVELVCSLAVNPMEELSPVNPFRQIVINTHSPGLIRFVHSRDPDALLFAKLAGYKDSETSTARVLRLLPVVGSRRAAMAEGGSLELYEVLDYLQPDPRTYGTLPGAQLNLAASEGQGWGEMKE